MKQLKHIFLGAASLLAATVPADANHVHLRVAWTEGALLLDVYDFETGASPADAYPFIVTNSGMSLVPSRDAYSFLGEAGATFFALPQEDNPDLTYLGVSVGAAPTSVFRNAQIHLRLDSASGPGHFSLYQVDLFGRPAVSMNTRDGLTAADDRLLLAPGAHEHMNWAFTAPGEYRLAFVAEAAPASGGPPIFSAPTTYRFRVPPPPPSQIRLKRNALPAHIEFRVDSRIGARLQILESENLRDWHPLEARLLATATWTFSRSLGTSRDRFWRVNEIFE